MATPNMTISNSTVEMNERKHIHHPNSQPSPAPAQPTRATSATHSFIHYVHQTPTVAVPTNRCLRVTSIKHNTTEARVRELFEGLDVESVIIIRGVPGFSPTEAVITMNTRREAQLAMEDFRKIREEAGEEVRARMITVQWA